jgi:glycosyltransferase involved in cell wall biosynthesis
VSALHSSAAYGHRGSPRTTGRPAQSDLPTLSVVIPALNEEESIGTTVQRCLDAREHIRRAGRVRDIEITVVSDGSTDRTVEIAQGLAAREPAVSLIVFEKNRGYGAAIKEGFARSTGDLVAFLDADGTCDPRVFADLCRALQEEGAAVALGSRMGPGTMMPRLRRLGNTVYALLLGSLSGQAVSDTASGMRVIRRDALADLYPLPDGLHFTPAMSARAIMSDIQIVEVPMAYAERVGESKLRVLRDGVRFLMSISDAALLYHPSRLFGMAAVACVVIGVLWGVYPAEFYLRNHSLEGWMIYRLLLCGLLLTSAFGLISAGVLSDQILSLVYRRRHAGFLSHLFARLLNRRRSTLVAGLAAAAAVALVWPGLLQYVHDGQVTIHWSRPVAAVFLLQVALVSVIHTVMRRIVDLWKSDLAHASRDEHEEVDVAMAAGVATVE